jgi:large repetitive protein
VRAPAFRRSAIAALVVLAVLAYPAFALARRSRLVHDSFAGARQSAFVAMRGSTHGLPCLTAGRPGSRGPIHGCLIGPHASPGHGALLLTRTHDLQASGVVMRRSFPTSRGLNLTFTAYSWGGIGSYMGRGGDGIAVMLLVAPPATRIGPTGSALGYDLQPPALDPNFGTTFPGIDGGYLGIGLDAFGNWTDAQGDAANCTTPPWARAQTVPATVTVRGPGDGVNGYCLLSSTESAPRGPLHRLRLDANRRGASRLRVNILLEPAKQRYVVRLRPAGRSRYRTVTTGPLPDYYYAPGTGELTPGLPPELTIAFAATTGWANDNHEIADVSAVEG